MLQRIFLRLCKRLFLSLVNTRGCVQAFIDVRVVPRSVRCELSHISGSIVGRRLLVSPRKLRLGHFEINLDFFVGVRDWPAFEMFQQSLRILIGT